MLDRRFGILRIFGLIIIFNKKRFLSKVIEFQLQARKNNEHNETHSKGSVRAYGKGYLDGHRETFDWFKSIVIK